MPGAGVRPAGRDERRVWDGEHGREGLTESAATCQASSSILAVKVQMSSPDENTWATQEGGVTSTILSDSCATSSKEICACVAIVA